MLIDAKYFQDHHKQAEEYFPTTFLEIHIINGELELIDYVGEETYIEVEAIAAKSERTTKEKRKLAAFRSALAEFTMADCIPALNLIPSNTGLVQSSITENFGAGSFKIASPKDIEKLVEMYKVKAYRFLDRYVSDNGGVIGKAVFSDE